MAYTTIDDPSAHFQATAYTGASTGAESITNTGNSNLQPDFLWSKRRDSSASHYLFDSSRGVNSAIFSDTTAAQDTASTYLASFDSDGFSTGSDSALAYTNRTYIAWQWKANGGTTSTNNDGNQTTTVQANTTAGFSIVTYEGTDDVNTYGHGLGAAPEAIIIKNYDQTGNWVVYHKNLNFPTKDLIYLNLNEASNDHNPTFNNTAPTSSVFTLGNYSLSNNSGDSHVAYCFVGKQGYSKFGGYTGNGNADGPFMYTGFKPALVIIKGTSGTKNWFMYDTTRNPSNLVVNRLIANGSEAENTGSGDDIDILSNGWKIRANPAALNENGEPFIYMAWAENPFVDSTGTPVPAR